LLSLYNKVSGKSEVFVPIADKVGIYVCGITPYDTTHLGHAFTYLSFDVLIRYLEYLGHTVRYVQNVTDIDDDVLRKAKEAGEDWLELGNRWTRHFIQDLQALNVRPPDVFPRATDVIPQMHDAISRLIAAGMAYASGGSVYYDVSACSDFGSISGLPESDWLTIANERGNTPDDPNKRAPIDFVLWQAKKPDEPFWKSPWGPGRPGWHIECSTMAAEYLGPTIDIHGGGGDLEFPHHECETAQACGVTGESFFARFWMHTAMVRYQGEKMSKSLGNLIWARDLLREHTADAVRILATRHPYHETWEYDPSELAPADDLASRVLLADQVTGGDGERLDPGPFVHDFEAYLDSNLDTRHALDVLASLSDAITGAAADGGHITAAQSTLRKLTTVFGLTLGRDVEPRVATGWSAHYERFAQSSSALEG